MIYSLIKDILKNGPSVLSLVDLDYSLKFGLIYLPNSITEFKYVILKFSVTLFSLQFYLLRVDCVLFPNELSKEYITNIVTNWLDWAKPFVCTKVSEILENVESFSTLCHLNQLSTVRDQINYYFVFNMYLSFKFDQHKSLENK